MFYLILLSLALGGHQAARVRTGSLWINPPGATAARGGMLELTIEFEPNLSVTVTGLDACLDFDRQVFDSPAVTINYITDHQMTDFSFGNSWPGHSSSYHYERIALPSNTGWTVDAGAHAVYTIDFPVRSDATLGQTVIDFTPLFATFSDAMGELLDPQQITGGSYLIIGAPATPTPTASPIPTPAPPIPALSTVGGGMLIALFGLLLILKAKP